jgi:hypothetical protein
MKSLVEMDLVRAIDSDRRRNGGRRFPRRADRRPDQVVIRSAQRGDGHRLERLAQLDSGAVPAGPALVAELDGVLVAALPLDGGRAIADPFVPSAPLVQMLELRASQLRAVG